MAETAMSVANAVEDNGLSVPAVKDDIKYSSDEPSSRAFGDGVTPARIVPTNIPLTQKQALTEATGQPEADILFPSEADDASYPIYQSTNPPTMELNHG